MSENIYTQEKDQFDVSKLSVNQLKWMRHYQKLCKRGQERASTRKEAMSLVGYVEDHHIYPECMGGSNDRSNMTFLSNPEHFIAHQLLAKIYPKNYKFIFSANMMRLGNGERKNNKLFGWIRDQYAKAMGDLKRGKTKETCPGVAAMVEKKTGMNKDNTEGYARMSKERLGQNSANCERVRLMAETKRGRTKLTCPGLAQLSETMSGRTKETHPYLIAKGEKHSEKMKGDGNSNAKTYTLKDKYGNIFITNNLNLFCDQNNLANSSIRSRGRNKNTNIIARGKSKGWSVLDAVLTRLK